jgi:hypothetical protein
MDEIAIPYHLAIPTIICLIGILMILIKRNTLFAKNKLLWTSITIFLCIYLYFVGTATLDSVFYQWDLNRYDLDKDRMFSGKELTSEQNEAMRKLTSDTGRNFSFITGFILAFLISLTIYVIGINFKRVKQNRV